MTTPSNHIPLSDDLVRRWVAPPEINGRAEYSKNIQLTRLEYEMRALAVSATLRGNATMPTPEEYQMWAKDLRRGRMSAGGSAIRFFKMIAHRQMGAEGRRLADELVVLIERYKDILLPAETPKAEPARVVDITGETRKARGIVKYGRLTDRVANRSA